MRRLALALLLAAGCGIDLAVPDSVDVTCVSDADCQDGKVCALRIGLCVTVVDDEPPRILSADTPAAGRLRIVYSEPVACSSITDTNAYAITPELPVTLASGSGCDSLAAFTSEVALFTDTQLPARTYAITVSGVIDSGGNPIAADGATATFSGFGLPPDPSPPDALTPPENARVLGATQGLAWTVRPGATAYIVEVATDPAFATQIAGSPFTVSAPAASLTLDGLADVTHYWRVRSDLTPVGTSLTAHDFDVLVDTVYVACAPGALCDDSGIQNGSRTRPYERIQRGLAAAAELATSLVLPSVAVKIATRAPGEAYAGPVTVQWQAVRLLGGYDATFTTRTLDPAATTIESGSTVLSILNIPAPITGLVESLTLRSTAGGGGAPALSVTAASSGLTVRHVVMQSNAASERGTLAVSGGPADGPVFDDCVVQTTDEDASGATAVAVHLAAPTFTGLRVGFTGVNLASAFGVLVTGPLPGELLFDDAVIAVPSTTGTSRAMNLDFRAPSAHGVVLRNARLSTGNAPSDTATITLSRYAPLTIDRSVIASGASTSSTHVVATDLGAQLIVRNSVLQNGDGPSGNCSVIRSAGFERYEVTNSALISSTSCDAALSFGGSDHAIFTNNLIVARGTTDVCVQQLAFAVVEPTRATPQSFNNNAFVHCATAYVIPEPDSVNATTTLQLNAVLGSPIRDGACVDGACPAASFADNVLLADAITDVFVDFDGPDGEYLTIADNDYHLKSTANVDIRNGGLPAGALACGPVGQNSDCNVPTTDSDGDARSAPYSIGPDEVP